MKKRIICLSILLYAGIASAQHNLSLHIEGVKKEEGKLYISLFNTEESYNQRNVYRSLIANASSETVSVDLSIPVGEYLFSIYQDNNCNGKLDTNLLGIPKEPFGFSNYNGKSAPGGFNKHKVVVPETKSTLTVHLYKI